MFVHLIALMQDEITHWIETVTCKLTCNRNWPFLLFANYAKENIWVF